MNEENQVYFVDSDKLPEEALKRKHRLEQDPTFRTNHMEYMEGMEVIRSDIKDKVEEAMKAFDYDAYTAGDVERALSHETCSIEDFKALLSPAAAPYLEVMARKAEEITKNHFGNTVYIFTPLYIANYCQNYCIYCGFNCYNNIRRKKLTFEEIEHEMQVIAKTGMEEILILTGESRAYSDVKYIGEAVKIARKYFRNIGIEIYPVNVDEYKYLHECGVDYVTVFQETYNTDKYETLHLMGHKRVWPYRFDAQERALMGGMRGAGFSALLGLDDFRKDALATALHVYYINRKYPHAELSLSCPRLRPIVNNDKINPRDVGEKELCQVLYVTVFQETYNTDKYETLHLMGHKRVWPYRFDAQERALMGGMRGAGFSALLGLDDFRKDALATALHVYYINRKYPHAELSLSCPRLRPIVNNDKINPRDVGEKELCQVLCAYRIFLPFAGITVSSRESAAFRNGITKICATKVSAGVSTGIGDHEEKYEGKEDADVGDEQFEINDGRSFASMYEDMEKGGLQPVLNDYIYV